MPRPSPHVPSARVLLPPDYELVGAHLDEGDNEAEIEASRLSTDRALGIWFAPRPGIKVDTTRGLRSWAFHISPRGEYSSAGFGGFDQLPTLLGEDECSLTSVGGRAWNVITYVMESKVFGTQYALTAYSEIGGGLYLRAGGEGQIADAETEGLAILSSFREGT